MSLLNLSFLAVTVKQVIALAIAKPHDPEKILFA